MRPSRIRFAEGIVTSLTSALFCRSPKTAKPAGIAPVSLIRAYPTLTAGDVPRVANETPPRSGKEKVDTPDCARSGKGLKAIPSSPTIKGRDQTAQFPQGFVSSSFFTCTKVLARDSPIANLFGHFASDWRPRNLSAQG